MQAVAPSSLLESLRLRPSLAISVHINQITYHLGTETAKDTEAAYLDMSKQIISGSVQLSNTSNTPVLFHHANIVLSVGIDYQEGVKSGAVIPPDSFQLPTRGYHLQTFYTMDIPLMTAEVYPGSLLPSGNTDFPFVLFVPRTLVPSSRTHPSLSYRLVAALYHGDTQIPLMSDHSFAPTAESELSKVFSSSENQPDLSQIILKAYPIEQQLDMQWEVARHHVAERSDELILIAHSFVTIRHVFGDGWAIGTCNSNMRTIGTFPLRVLGPRSIVGLRIPNTDSKKRTVSLQFQKFMKIPNVKTSPSVSASQVIVGSPSTISRPSTDKQHTSLSSEATNHLKELELLEDLMYLLKSPTSTATRSSCETDDTSTCDQFNREAYAGLKRFTAKREHTPRAAHELLIDIGDTIALEETFGDGWARGINLALGDSGDFPLRCIGLEQVSHLKWKAPKAADAPQSSSDLPREHSAREGTSPPTRRRSLAVKKLAPINTSVVRMESVKSSAGRLDSATAESPRTELPKAEVVKLDPVRMEPARSQPATSTYKYTPLQTPTPPQRRYTTTKPPPFLSVVTTQPLPPKIDTIYRGSLDVDRSKPLSSPTTQVPVSAGPTSRNPFNFLSRSNSTSSKRSRR
ncbi:uncharacterized protein BJ171DRAFT_568226 [Polychytrium aggregatum]|uniref:uncharacterized protein n=1 Tax=Polychytrium aggregatum TaxID=110093 RepID=UPI0022FECE84|nr:uncharacterized protein BJ171DRAFT_568226 [Polychytrium aggregatum]KAI9204469.1 hypothetical protein BJ171DRAFT_568226 [Polychytrium aggregatum]